MNASASSSGFSTSTPPRRMIVLICAARGAPLIRKDDLDRKGEMMTDHEVVSREEWAPPREKLLAREKEHPRLGDELARQRRELPWVRVEKEYHFDTDDGEKTLADLFE